ncbi:MAG: hypothetical protein KJ040_03205 [Gammaproteobacteria bacterium]|nr:hypothetical protein [Gammaproteobacteria bacterium]
MQHRDMVRKEVLLAVLGNAVVAVIIVWALYGGEDLIPVLGTDGGAFGVVPGTFLFTLGMTVGLTRTIRSRVRKGVIAALPLSEAPGIARRLPQNLLVRGLLMALSAEICLVPATIALLSWLAPDTWSFGAVLAFNVAYFAGLCLLVLPAVLWRALCDSPAVVQAA